MSHLAARHPRFQHVVFPGDVEPRAGALNLTPHRAPAPSHALADLPQHDEAFLNAVLRGAGLCPDQYKPDSLARRLTACLRAVRSTSPMAARRAVEGSAAMTADALDALVIGVTAFFRDAHAFTRLRDAVLPDLLSERSGTLRIWSAGCSDGQELYSVAMLLAERNCLLRSQLTGTDCRPNALRRATAGRFTADEVRSIPAALCQRYFVPDPAEPDARDATDSATAIRARGGWRALDVLRHTMQFRLGDITRQAEVGPFDLILCRNVSIYLLPEAAAALWRRLRAALRPGGVLMVGKAEFPTGASGLTNVAPGFFRRTGGG